MAAKGNERAAYRKLRSLGLTPAQAAGAVGSLTGESGRGLSANAVNPSSGALGIGQWLGGRAKGVRKGDVQGQLNHLVGELKGSERGALAALKRAKGPQEAAEIWTRAFERPSAGEIANSIGARKAAALDIFRSLKGDAGSSPGTGDAAPRGLKISGQVTPAGEKPSMAAAVQQVLAGGGGKVHGAFKRSAKGTGRLGQAVYLYQHGLATETTPTTATQTITRTGGKAPKGAASLPSGGGYRKGGKLKVTGPDPGRLAPELVNFADRVSGLSGKTLTGLSGATHSRLTVNGNVSEHTTGNAVDIPARGGELIRLGRNALVAAGWSRGRANKVQGGLFNVIDPVTGRRHQIIFNTHEGGDHTGHLHVSSSHDRRS